MEVISIQCEDAIKEEKCSLGSPEKQDTDS